MPDYKEEQRRIAQIALDAHIGECSPAPVASDMVHARLRNPMPSCLLVGLMFRHNR